MWCCFSIYKGIVPDHPFLVLGMDRILLHSVILLVKFRRHQYIFLYLLCVCCRGLLVSLGKLCCTVGNQSSVYYLFFFRPFSINMLFTVHFAFQSHPHELGTFLVRYDLVLYCHWFLVSVSSLSKYNVYCFACGECQSSVYCLCI